VQALRLVAFDDTRRQGIAQGFTGECPAGAEADLIARCRLGRRHLVEQRQCFGSLVPIQRRQPLAQKGPQVDAL
jgi:hypothetical protein